MDPPRIWRAWRANPFSNAHPGGPGGGLGPAAWVEGTGGATLEWALRGGLSEQVTFELNREWRKGEGNILGRRGQEVL